MEEALNSISELDRDSEMAAEAHALSYAVVTEDPGRHNFTAGEAGRQAGRQRGRQRLARKDGRRERDRSASYILSACVREKKLLQLTRKTAALEGREASGRKRAMALQNLKRMNMCLDHNFFHGLLRCV